LGSVPWVSDGFVLDGETITTFLAVENGGHLLGHAGVERADDRITDLSSDKLGGGVGADVGSGGVVLGGQDDLPALDLLGLGWPA